MSGDDLSIQDQPRENITLSAMQKIAEAETEELSAEHLTSLMSLMDSLVELGNPWAAKFATKRESLKNHAARIQKPEKSEKKGTTTQDNKDLAQQFEKRNPELKAVILLILRDKIQSDDSKDEILRKLAEVYPDVTLADEALEFLVKTTTGDLAKTMKEAKEEFHAQHARSIIAGRNISAQAREAAGKGLGTTDGLRDMYRDITGNPREPTALFEELSAKYPNYEDLKKVIKFLLHSLGADMKSKGPSIEKGLLHRLISETRSNQAILGVYSFFRQRMPLIEKMFRDQNLEMPPELTFENLAKQFMTLANERYPSSAKVSQTASKLGIE